MQMSESLVAYHKAIDLDPENVTLRTVATIREHNRKAVCHVLAAEFSEAREELKLCTRKGPAPKQIAHMRTMDQRSQKHWTRIEYVLGVRESSPETTPGSSSTSSSAAFATVPSSTAATVAVPASSTHASLSAVAPTATKPLPTKQTYPVFVRLRAICVIYVCIVISRCFLLLDWVGFPSILNAAARAQSEEGLGDRKPRRPGSHVV